MEAPPAAAAVDPFVLLDDLPLPGGGRTWERWQAFARMGAADVAGARLGEGHADAQAIVAELAPAATLPSGRLGVWAAEAPRGGVTATPDADGWTLRGARAWCSGATTLDAAVVTAHAPDGLRLFLLPLGSAGLKVEPDTWPAVGMAATDSLTVRLDGVRLPTAAALGGPGAYLSRPGFWHGAIGVAACWFGGAVGVAHAAVAAARASGDPHKLAHLGAIDSALTALSALLQAAAHEIDADPLDAAGDAARRAQRARAVVEQGCTEVLARTGRATGATPLCHDGDHARRVADLTVYLRQSHGEADLATLGALVAERSDPGWLTPTVRPAP